MGATLIRTALICAPLRGREQALELLADHHAEYRHQVHRSAADRRSVSEFSPKWR
jgi:hypothetical protein